MISACFRAVLALALSLLSWGTTMSDRADFHREHGFTLFELVLTVSLVLVIGAISVPMSGNALTQFRLSGDARGVANTISVAKMRAAAHFARTRVFVDLSDGSYYLETYDKDTSSWVSSGGTTHLSDGNSFGKESIENAPSNTQASIEQAAACLDDDGETIGNSACVIFNSRGIPVDTTNTPTSNFALYINNGETVFGATVSATGLIRLWRAQAVAGTATWMQQ